MNLTTATAPGELSVNQSGHYDVDNSVVASVIIVNYNGMQFVKDCLDSLMKQTFGNFEIIFVDNNSSDGSLKFVEENYSLPKLKIICSDRNLGFSGGNNLGYKHSRGEYIVLLNNDTSVEANWLEELINCIKQDDAVGAVQSLVLTEGIPLKYYMKNGTVNLLGHNIMEVFPINENGIGEIIQLNGCSMIIRKSTVDKFGELFPEEYFAYAEDTFLSFRLKFNGYKLLHNSNSVVHHKGGGATVNKKRSNLYFYQERNRLLNFKIFFPGSFQIKYFPYLTFNFFLKLIASVFSAKYSAGQLLKAYVWIFINHKKIYVMRETITKEKKVNDNEVLQFLSGKIFNGDGLLQKFVNAIFIFYCKVTKIRILENKE